MCPTHDLYVTTGLCVGCSGLSACSHLWSAAPVDVHADGTVGSAATHEQMSPVVRLHHADEVPTAVLQNTGGEKRP